MKIASRCNTEYQQLSFSYLFQVSDMSHQLSCLSSGFLSGQVEKNHKGGSVYTGGIVLF